MNYLAIFSVLFLYSFKTFCSERAPISQLPAQQAMSNTPYMIPKHHYYSIPETTPLVIEKTVYCRMDNALLELHKDGFRPSFDALSQAAATVAHQVTLKRKIGVCSLMFGAGTAIVTAPSPFLQSHPEIPFGGVVLAACGTALLCDSMIDCCCWRHKMASTKKLIRENHTKVD